MQNIDRIFGEDEIGPYYRTIRDIPVLSHEEQARLYIQGRRGNSRAREKLVAHNLRLVVKISSSYFSAARRCGVPIQDLVSAGNSALTRAVNSKTYNPKITRFISYAGKAIRCAVRDAFADYHPVIRIPRAAIKKHPVRLKSLDSPVYFGGNDHSEEESYLMNILRDEKSPDPCHELERKDMLEKLRAVLRNYGNKRELKILFMRYGLNGKGSLTLEEVGKVFGITRERVRQIQKKAMGKLRERFKV